MRTLWRDLVPDPRLLQRAFSLDAVAEELPFVAGPLLVGLLLHSATPSVGIAVSVALVRTGSLALTSSPAVRGEVGHKKASAGSAPSEELGSGVRPAPPGRRPLQGGPGLRQAVAVSATVAFLPACFALAAAPAVLSAATALHRPRRLAAVTAAPFGNNVPLSVLVGAGVLLYMTPSPRTRGRVDLPVCCSPSPVSGCSHSALSRDVRTVGSSACTRWRSSASLVRRPLARPGGPGPVGRRPVRFRQEADRPELPG